MKNKRIKQKRIQTFMIVITIVILAALLTVLWLYQVNINRKTNTFTKDLINAVLEKYPDVDESEIYEIINNGNINKEKGNAFFDRYGIIDNSENVFEELDRRNNILKLTIVSLFALLVLSGVFSISRYLKIQNKEIDELTQYLRRINNKDYNLDINNMTEDELSILKSELYKITIKLKEAADNSINDKAELKEALENISHQIKTPLTSMSIMIDSLVDEPDMDEDIRMEFLSDIKRETNNISFMIHNLLKLSKIESNTITFAAREHGLKEIVGEALKNVEVLRDLKNIEVINDVGDEVINCDGKWQIEAITNIIKNCYEHSEDSSKLKISSEKNNVYCKLIIRDYGEGIDEKDLPHIFERFYRSKGSGNDSYGIGMALTKSIIEGEGGSISVNVHRDGSEFIIKYYNSNIKDTF